jgi:hypothetical protein
MQTSGKWMTGKRTTWPNTTAYRHALLDWTANFITALFFANPRKSFPISLITPEL